MNYSSEEYALLCEKSEYTWHKKHNAEIAHYKSIINSYLMSKSPKAYESLKFLFNDSEFIDTYSLKHDFAYMSIIMKIYEQEEKANEAHTILELGNSMDTIIHFVKQLKFYLWRIEFANDLNTLDLINDYIMSNHISTFMLNYTIHISSYDKSYVIIKLIDYFTKIGRLEYTYSLANYLFEIDHNNKTALYILAELAKLSGNSQLASHYSSLIDKISYKEFPV